MKAPQRRREQHGVDRREEDHVHRQEAIEPIMVPIAPEKKHQGCKGTRTLGRKFLAPRRTIAQSAKGAI